MTARSPALCAESARGLQGMLMHVQLHCSQCSAGAVEVLMEHAREGDASTARASKPTIAASAALGAGGVMMQGWGFGH